LLDELLHEHRQKNVTVIDFESRHIEGGEMSARHGNYWGAFKRRFRILDVLDRTLLELDSPPDLQFGRSTGYSRVASRCHPLFSVVAKSMLAKHGPAKNKVEE